MILAARHVYLLFLFFFYRDRLVPVHEGFGLPAYMIRLMTSTMMPLTRDGASETLYVLCDKDGKQHLDRVHINLKTDNIISIISKQIYAKSRIW
jgi:hypothetical protein